MRGYAPAYEVLQPRSLKEALALLAREPGAWRPLAGGTDLMVSFEAGKLPPGRYLSLWKLDDLRGIRTGKSAVTIGALTTYTAIRGHAVLAKHFPMLGEAARLTGAPAIQNRGTLGGNIANASPAADTPPALLAYDAEVELVSRAGARWVPYTELHLGYKKLALRPDELIARVRLPIPARRLVHSYRKVGTRGAQAISKVCVALVARTEKKIVTEVRIGLGSVAPVPFRAFAAEGFLTRKRLGPSLAEEAARALRDEIAPIDDIRSTREYRLLVAGNLLADFVDGLGRR